MKIIIAVLLWCTFLHAEELYIPLIAQLSDEDFDKRTRATHLLSQYPAEYIYTFLYLSNEAKDVEVIFRLKTVARNIFRRKVLIEDDEWQRLNAFVGITWFRHWYQGGTVMMVNIVDGNSVCMDLQSRDVVVSVDNTILDIDYHLDMSELFLAGHEHVVKVRRYETGEPDPKVAFLELEFKIKPTWKRDYDTDYPACEKLEQELWDRYTQD